MSDSNIILLIVLLLMGSALGQAVHEDRVEACDYGNAAACYALDNR